MTEALPMAVGWRVPLTMLISARAFNAPNLSIWNSITDESSFIINLYANDSAGNTNSDHIITLYKDVSEPSLIVNMPIDGTYWNIPPDVQATASDPYFHTIWYVVDEIKIMLTYGLFIVGFIILIKGASVLVDGATSVARRLNVTDLVIGLTVVAFGTSTPELFVNIIAS